jgi:Zn-dependent M32 family carboxypeptidase
MLGETKSVLPVITDKYKNADMGKDIKEIIGDLKKELSTLSQEIKAQISQCLHQFSTSCLCLNQENLSLTFESVFLIPKCPPVTLLCNCVKG